jgi:glycylpeptide N-tetradecanoyltransferase
VELDGGVLIDGLDFQNSETKEITGFVSFYGIPTSVMKHPVHKVINVAYMFYYGAQDQATLPKLLNDALIMSKKVKLNLEEHVFA